MGMDRDVRRLGQLDELYRKKLFKLSIARRTHFRYTKRRAFLRKQCESGGAEQWQVYL